MNITEFLDQIQAVKAVQQNTKAVSINLKEYMTLKQAPVNKYIISLTVVDREQTA